MSGIDEFFERVAALRREGTAFAIATVVSRQGPVSSHLGDRAIVFGDGRMEGFVGGSCSRDVVREQCLDALGAGQPRLVSIRPDAGEAEIVGDDAVHVPMSCGSKGAVDVYIEPFVPARTIVVVGYTPVAEAIVRLASALEYHVVHVVSRDELRDATREPARTLPLDELGGFLAELPATAMASLGVVVATQGHYDEAALDAALRARPAYAGLVASPRRGAEVRDELASRGLPAEDVAALRSPAGLALGARHPGEVAVSILAELIELHPSPRVFAAAMPPPVETGAASPAPDLDLPLASAIEGPPEKAHDPVCGMEVVIAPGAVTAEYEGQTFWFCCGGCKKRFEAEPEKYAAATR